MRLQVDNVREAWLLVEVKHDTNLMQVRGHLSLFAGWVVVRKTRDE